MKLENSTDYPPHYLRRMVAWCCRELGMPARFCKSATFRQRRKPRFSGHAYHWRGGGDIVVSLAPDSFFPWTENAEWLRVAGIVRTLNDRTECLVNVTAHELRHLQAELEGERTRGDGLRIGSSERATEHDAQKVLAAFRADREALEVAWRVAPPVKAKPSAVDQRAAKVNAALERWQRKLKLAQTKVKQYRRRATYYQRKAATGATP